MAPNKRGGPLSDKKKAEISGTKPAPASNGGACAHFDEPAATNGGSCGSYDQGMISKEEVESRGSGTNEKTDTYDSKRLFHNEKRVFFTGLMFLTRLPCPGSCDHHPAFLMRSVQWFPLIGTIVGLWGAVWLQGAAVVWSPAIAAAISTMSTMWLTGCFHEDGLSDCFDGFGGGWGRRQIMRIMKDSRVGTYALVGMSLVLVMKLRSLEFLLSQPMEAGEALGRAARVLIVAHTASRWTTLPLIYYCTYIQDEEDAKRGMYNWFAQSQRLLTPIRVLIGTGTLALVPYLLLPLHEVALVCATVLLVSLGAGYYGNLVLGGIVGDFLGATIQVAELLIYLALTADLESAATNWKPIAVLAGVAAMPLIYSRSIIDTKC